MKKSTIIILAAIFVPLLLCCLTGVGIVIWSKGQADAMASLEQSCLGPGNPDARAYTAGPGAHKVVAIERSGADWSADYDMIPDQWEGENPEETDLVLCLEEEVEENIESCEYNMEGGGTSTIDRIGFMRRARLVQARNGQLVQEFTFRGTVPAACNDNELFMGSANRTRREGGRVGVMEVEAFLRPHIVGGPAAVPTPAPTPLGTQPGPAGPGGNAVEAPK